MRIVLTCDYSPWSAYFGGSQRSTHQIASALANAGHDVHVVYTRSPLERIEPDVPPPYHVHWATFYDVKSRCPAPLGALSAVSVARTVARLHDQSPVDAVHANGEEGALIGRLRGRRGFCFVVTPRYSSYPDALAENRPGWRQARRAMLWATRPKYPQLGVALRDADRVCPASRSAANRVQRVYRLDPACITIVPNGVGSMFFDVTWAPPGDDAPLLFFGRLDERKGVRVLIDAISGLDGAPPLLVIGRGDQEGPLRALVRARGLESRVRFEPWASPEELARHIARACMVVLPSRFESFGNAMAESMAVGAPLISTRGGSIPEVVEDGRTGILVPPDDPVALRRAMVELLAQPERAARLGAAGRERVRAMFRWDVTARRYLEIYAGSRA